MKLFLHHKLKFVEGQTDKVNQLLSRVCVCACVRVKNHDWCFLRANALKIAVYSSSSDEFTVKGEARYLWRTILDLMTLIPNLPNSDFLK